MKSKYVYILECWDGESLRLWDEAFKKKKAANKKLREEVELAEEYYGLPSSVEILVDENGLARATVRGETYKVNRYKVV